MNQSQIGSVVPVLIVIVAVLVMIGAVLFNKVKPAEPIREEKPAHSFALGSLRFAYPEILNINKVDNVTTLTHSISYTHPDPCDFRGEAPQLTTLIDFNASFSAHGVDLKTAMRENESIDFVGTYFPDEKPDTSAGSIIRPFEVGVLKGYRVSMGIEGCGRSTYYFPLSVSQTIVITRPYISEFSAVNGNANTYLELPGVIPPEQSEAIFIGILSSAK